MLLADAVFNFSESDIQSSSYIKRLLNKIILIPWLCTSLAPSGGVCRPVLLGAEFHRPGHHPQGWPEAGQRGGNCGPVRCRDRCQRQPAHSLPHQVTSGSRVCNCCCWRQQIPCIFWGEECELCKLIYCTNLFMVQSYHTFIMSGSISSVAFCALDPIPRGSQSVRSQESNMVLNLNPHLQQFLSIDGGCPCLQRCLCGVCQTVGVCRCCWDGRPTDGVLPRPRRPLLPLLVPGVSRPRELQPLRGRRCAGRRAWHHGHAAGEIEAEPQPPWLVAQDFGYQKEYSTC